jgi:hypothetical protein
MSDLYDTDTVLWAEEQAKALRDRSANALDWDNLAEEIESLAKRDKREIRHRLAVICEHLLKWRFQPGERSGSWRGSIVEARDRIADLIKESPTLRPYPATVLNDAWPPGRRKAEADTGLAGLPASCPWPIEAVLDHEFWPGDD